MGCAPIDRFGGRRVRHALPPDIACGHSLFGDQRNVGEDTVAPQRGHRVRVALLAGAGRDAEEAVLRIDGPEVSCRIRLDPCNVVADGPDLPAIKALGRDEHGEVGLATRTGKSSGDVRLLRLAGTVWGAFHADDQHMLRHPAFVASDIGGDAEREALLAQQRIAAVARAVGPDLPRLWKVNDVLGVILRPCYVRLACRQRCAERVQARDNTLLILFNLPVHRSTDAGHNAHVNNRIGGIRKLYPDL